jgi:hypothetical protein
MEAEKVERERLAMAKQDLEREAQAMRAKLQQLTRELVQQQADDGERASADAKPGSTGTKPSEEAPETIKRLQEEVNLPDLYSRSVCNSCFMPGIPWPRQENACMTTI